MASRIFRVPMWVKISFFWFAVLLSISLIGHQVSRRIAIAKLSMEHATQPILHDTIAPAFSLPVGDSNKRVHIKDLRGRFVLLNFWATWCSSCVEEMASLDALAVKFKDKMTVVAISVDEDWHDVKKFFANRPANFLLLHDRGQAVTQLYGVEKFPESVVVSPTGQAIARFVGKRDWDSPALLQYFDEMVFANTSLSKTASIPSTMQ